MNSRVLLAAALFTLAQPAIAQGIPIRPVMLEVTIGADRDGDEYLFGRINYVAAALDGRIYVLDGKACIGRIYTPTGLFTKTLGGRGGGPGEFQCPGSGLEVRASELLSVDGMTGRVARYTLDGNHIETKQHYTVSRGSALVHTYILRHGSLLSNKKAPIGATFGIPKDRFHSVNVRGPGGGRAREVARFHDHWAYVAPKNDRSFIVTAASGFGNGGAWAMLADSAVAIVDGYTGAVTWYSETPAGLRETRRDSLGERSRPVTPADLDAVAVRFKKEELTGRFGSGVNVVNAPTQWSVAHRALFAPDGTLWVGGVPQNGFVKWTAFPATGEKFAVRLPGDFWVSTVVNDKIYGYANDTDDGPVVRVYGITAPTPRPAARLTSVYSPSDQ